MSGEIFVETSVATSFGLPLPIAQHLYLVYRSETGAEYVLRGGPEGDFWPFGDLTIEVNVLIEDSADRRGRETPEDRASTPLDFGPLSDDQAWGLMVKYATWIEDEGLDYRLLAENSNAFVGALLHAAGGEPEEMLPTGIGVGDAIGFSAWDSIIDDVAPPEDWILRGTADADRLTGIQSDDTIIGFDGRDKIFGGQGDDLIRAGGGDDRVKGGKGDDRLLGGAGNDVLRGQAGDDKLNGGIGSDRMTGGAGADLFVFRKMVAGEVDTIIDFDPTQDRLKISGPEVSVQEAADAVLLLWGDHTIRLEGLTAEDLDCLV